VPFEGTEPDMTVRLATQADGPACAAIYRPYVAETAISFELEPPTAEEMAGRIARVTAYWPWVVGEVEGVVRAYAYATRHRERSAYDWTTETTVYVDRDFRARGLGRAAMHALIAVLRLQGFHLLVAGITAPNPGSVRLHESLGFERIGEFEAIGWKFDGWHGVEFWALELGPREPVPDPVTPITELAGTPELEAALRGHRAR
jgi:L-amino acid N-acyltransferase YncA